MEELAPEAAAVRRTRAVCGPDAVLATNTSALSVTEIASARLPARVVGMHFFNPAPLMPLVEIVRAELSSDEAFETAFAFRRADRQVCDPLLRHAGFVVNRVLIPLLNDCVRGLDEARVTVEDLDAGMGRHRLADGPCELVDLVGVDVHVQRAGAPREAAGAARLRRRGSSRCANAGLPGRKSGRGFDDTSS